jgi:hypothetical protein
MGDTLMTSEDRTYRATVTPRCEATATRTLVPEQEQTGEIVYVVCWMSECRCGWTWHLPFETHTTAFERALDHAFNGE